MNRWWGRPHGVFSQWARGYLVLVVAVPVTFWVTTVVMQAGGQRCFAQGSGQGFDCLNWLAYGMFAGVAVGLALYAVGIRLLGLGWGHLLLSVGGWVMGWFVLSALGLGGAWVVFAPAWPLVALLPGATWPSGWIDRWRSSTGHTGADARTRSAPRGRQLSPRELLISMAAGLVALLVVILVLTFAAEGQSMAGSERQIADAGVEVWAPPDSFGYRWFVAPHSGRLTYSIVDSDGTSWDVTVVSAASGSERDLVAPGAVIRTRGKAVVRVLARRRVPDDSTTGRGPDVPARELSDFAGSMQRRSPSWLAARETLLHRLVSRLLSP